ncbi:HAD family hydrolase [Klebsiella pneumoniae subsp. pneumoniae]|nr:HAD family hydrolase [Klebsiella pneumoniae subsp. pneumoniae]
MERAPATPLAQAIVREALATSAEHSACQRPAGAGGLWYRSRSQGGSRILICAASKAAPAEHEAQIQQLESAGQTVVLVMRGETLLGILALRDTLRDDARQAVDALHQLGVQGVMPHRDNPRAAAAIASELGLEFRAGLLPADKVNAR